MNSSLTSAWLSQIIDLNYCDSDQFISFCALKKECLKTNREHIIQTLTQQWQYTTTLYKYQRSRKLTVTTILTNLHHHWLSSGLRTVGAFHYYGTLITLHSFPESSIYSWDNCSPSMRIQRAHILLLRSPNTRPHSIHFLPNYSWCRTQRWSVLIDPFRISNT